MTPFPLRPQPLLLALAILAGCGEPTPASIERRERREAERAAARERAEAAAPDARSEPGAERLPGQPDYDEARLERLVLDAANRVRRAEGLATLRPDAAMDAAAVGHSRYLVASEQFSHTGRGGSTAAERAREAGVSYRAYAENLYQSGLYRTRTERIGPGGRSVTYDWMTPETLAAQAVQGWLDSPGHRRNLLNPTYGRGGVGVAFSEELGWTVTMVYAD